MIKKKILVFSNSFPFGHGEQFLQEEIRFISSDFNITIIPLFSESMEEVSIPLPEVAILKPLFPYQLKNKFRLISAGLYGFSVRRFITELRNINRKNLARSLTNLIVASLISSMTWTKLRRRNLLDDFSQFDLIYFYWGDNAAYIVPLLRNVFSGKIITRFHGSDLYESVKGGYIPFRRGILSSLDMAVFVSDHGRNYLLKKYSDIHFNAETFRLGVIDHGPGPVVKNEVLSIVSCSNMVPLKRIHLIVGALSEIKFPVSWVHFGDGPDFANIRMLADSLPEKIRWDLRGNIDHENLTDYYRFNGIDLFINTSESEGLPISIMEALSFGIPVIATDAGGTSEIVNDFNGYLVPVKAGSHDLAGKINHFFNRNDKEQLRDAARQTFLNKCDAGTNYKHFTDFLNGFLKHDPSRS